MKNDSDDDFSSAISRLVDQFPELAQHGAVGALRDIENVSSRDAIEVLQDLLLQPSFASQAAATLRGVALPAIAGLVQRAQPSADLSIALIGALQLIPHLKDTVAGYLAKAPPPYAYVDGQDYRRDAELATAAFLALRSCESLRQAWSWGDLVPLLGHKDPSVRWYACQSLGEMVGLRDAVARHVESVVLTSDELVACELGWEEKRAKIALERSAATGCVELGNGAPGTPPPARAASGRKRKLSSRDSTHDVLPGFVRLGGVDLARRPDERFGRDSGQPSLVVTRGVEQNVRALAMGLCLGSPILLEGPPGSGKTAAISHLAEMTGNVRDMLSLHLDDQMDAKSLMGTYVCTSRPGEFVWQPGPLTQAVVQGRWVVIEDVNFASSDVLAALIPLAERRTLHVAAQGQDLEASPGFALFATVTSTPGGAGMGAYGSSRTVTDLLGGLFHHVCVAPPDGEEQLEILVRLHPKLSALLPTALDILSIIRIAFRQLPASELAAASSRVRAVTERHRLAYLDLLVGRHFSLRDLGKWCARMESVHGALLERNATRLTRQQPAEDIPLPVRTAAFVEAADCFVGLVGSADASLTILRAIADLWALPPSEVERYCMVRKPSIHIDRADLHVGRATLPRDPATTQSGGDRFASTSHALRTMERVAVAVAANEPILLVGESGVGKTTVVQEIAKQAGANMIVLNLSQQTDSSDLLGGFRPVQPSETVRPLLTRFGDLVTRTWRKGKNAEFVSRVHAILEKRKYKRVVKAFRAAIDKVDLSSTSRLGTALREEWIAFEADVAVAEAALMAAEGGFAFSFVEGALVQALQEGSWLLLDEINLAPPEALERMAGLLDGPRGSLVLAERGDGSAIIRHESFRLFAAMNPATDAGKRDLPAPLRNHFTELWVSEPTSHDDFAAIVDRYLPGIGAAIVDGIVRFYFKVKEEADAGLQDGAGHKPAYNLRTLCRALEYCAAASSTYGLARALCDGLDMSFVTQLDQASVPRVKFLIEAHCLGGKKIQTLARARVQAPGPSYVQFEGFWIEAGEAFDPHAEPASNFILTPTVRKHLMNLARALLLRRYPVLLQGPTSSGKTSLVAYMAERTGHGFVRINNHEQTDLQEYVGRYISDETGRLVFKEGLLVQAMRRGDWVVLDELNLAPTEVLEALNRLLDDNRELYVPELQETVRPHPHFMLFATQNPPGIYAGRKTLSRAFRSRFLELQVDEIPEVELETILEKRSLIPPSYAKKMVCVMHELQRMRAGSNVFAGRHGFVTPRDLFRWAGRHANGYEQLAEDGFLVLGERLRSAEERKLIKAVLGKQLGAKENVEMSYLKAGSGTPRDVVNVLGEPRGADAAGELIRGMVWTQPMLRMYDILKRCLEFSEPTLLVGETGTGKTSVCQTIAYTRGQRLHILNCNQHTEASDFLGGFRPNRMRERAARSVQVTLDELQRSSIITPEERSILLGLDDLSPKNLVAVGMAVASVAAAAKNRPAEPDALATFLGAAKQLQESLVEARVPFCWVDGPLVHAMKNGDIMLIDELNLADDSVLERLNSVLEPGRTLTLAEKGGDASEVIVAHPEFRIVATMNPGGDYGKKELSPALSNRFTNVWIPALNGVDDLKAILSTRLNDAKTRDALVSNIVSFWGFFNANIAHLAHQVLSIRDLLSWVDFINAASSDVETSLVFAHGAQLVLLDGLGLGVGLSVELSNELKRSCWDVLTKLMSEGAARELVSALQAPNSPQYWIDSSTSGKTWGIAPFFIAAREEYPVHAFDFSAPTIARNTLRVLRAMQLRKSILLEGSPGVGKTSLVSAIASATGNYLVRINLSEQTDMMDLLGADLPVEGASGEFAWSDGPLLHAVKEGAWVLLDELNLANQTVLEGLNALLDHRSEVYIPELDQTFKCPPGFRIFGAQNPLQEGGGRKGLPKSFLNRFTRVHVELLTSTDLLLISKNIHPSIPEETLRSMVIFLESLQACSTTMAGGPWEFNLRDLLRWCDLIDNAISERSPELSNDVAACYFSTLLFQRRVRSEQDRRKIQELLREAWSGRPDALGLVDDVPVQDILLDQSTLQFGWASVPRSSEPRARFQSATRALRLLHSQRKDLESLAYCAQFGWMGLLVGPPGAGKASVVRAMAELSGNPLVELALTSGTDTSDLLGSFEQVEPSRHVMVIAHRVLDCVMRSTNTVAMNISDVADLGALETLGKACATCWEILQDETVHSALDGAEHLLRQLTAILAAGSASQEISPADVLLSSVLDEGRAILARLSQGNETPGRFEWVDGPLTRAIEDGHWVLLDNANLCNPTVLDRLNSLLEPGGTLQLNECGSSKGLRVVAPHPNFRLFLTINPQHGEVSRAMRNRGIEIFMMPSLASFADVEADVRSIVGQAGIVGQAQDVMVTTHLSLCKLATHAQRAPPSLRYLQKWVDLSNQLALRGWSFGGALRVAFEQLYVSKAEEELQLNSSIRDAFEDSLHDATATPATVELYRAACWPLHLTVEDAARNAVLFGVLRDASGLLSLLNTPALVAGLSRNVWLPIRSGLAPSGWEGCYPPSHDAVLLTAGLSRVMAAVPILVERSSLADEMTRSRLLEALLRALRLLEDGSGSGGHVLAYPALFLKRLFEQETRGRILALQASLLPSLGLDKAVANLAPSGLIMTAGSIKPTLLSTQQDAPLVEELKRAARKLKALVTTVRSACLLELSTQTVRDSEGVNTLLELSYWRRAHPKDRQQLDSEHAIVDWLYPLLHSIGACEAAALSDESLVWTEDLLAEVEAVQEWRHGLFKLVHPHSRGKDPQRVDASLLEHLLYTWNVLSKQLNPLISRMSSSPLVSQLGAIIDNINACMGLRHELEARPLLWQHGGHPLIASEESIAKDYNVVRSFLELTGAPPESALNAGMSLEDIVGLPRRDNEHMDGETSDAAAKDEFGARCSLAVDVELRRRLVESLNLLMSFVVLKSSGDMTLDPQGTHAVESLMRSFLRQRAELYLKMEDPVEHDLTGTYASNELDPALMRSESVRALQKELTRLQEARLDKRMLELFGSTNGILSLPTPQPGNLSVQLRDLAHRVIETRGHNVSAAVPLLQLASVLEGASSVHFDAARRLRLERGLSLGAWFDWLHGMWQRGDALGLKMGSSRVFLASFSLSATSLVSSSGNVALKDHRYRQTQLKSAMECLLEGPGMPADALAAALWRAAVLLAATTLEAHHSSIDESNAASFLTAVEWLRTERVVGSGGPKDRMVIDCVAAACASSNHAVLRLLVSKVLGPALEILLFEQSTLCEELARLGQVWVLLGLARLNLLVPPSTGDPAAENTFKLKHNDAVLSDILHPEIEARTIFGSLPGGPSESATLQRLAAMVTAKEEESDALRALCTYRPQNPQYNVLRADVLQFAGRVCSIDKLTALLENLQQDRGTSYIATAASLRDTLVGWTTSIADQFPHYRDIVQPLQCAGFEMLTGLDLIINDPSHQIAQHSALAGLLGYPHALLRGQVDPGAVQSMLRAPGSEEAQEGTHDALATELKLMLAVLRDKLAMCVSSKLSTKCTTEGSRVFWWTPLHGVFAAFVDLWERIGEEEEKRAAEEGEMFKTKERETAMDSDEEDFRESFPEEASAFADLENIDFEDEDRKIGHDFGVSEQDALHSKKALMGEALHALVQAHKVAFLMSESVDPQVRSLDDFRTSYRLGADLLKGATCSGSLDDRVWTGHVTAVSLEFALLDPQRRRSRTKVDLRQACPEEAVLVQVPVEALRARLKELLEQWPDHPILMQLDLIAERILLLKLRSNLKSFMTGLELLLSRVHAWQETAAKHVSLEAQQGQLLALAIRWRKLELEGWESLLERTIGKSKEQALKAWFHLYRMLIGTDPKHATPSVTAVEALPVLEDFIRGSSIGEFETRLEMLNAFANQLGEAGFCVSVSTVAEPLPTVELGRMVSNVSKYYEVLLPKVREAIAVGMKPFEKQLKDFISLAKWEDRGYYALKTSIEKSQRQLHKLARHVSQHLATLTSDVLQSELNADIKSGSFATFCAGEESARDGETTPLVAWAEEINQVASSIAQQAAALATDGQKGHVSRKRASLKFMMDALAAAGLSKSEFAVPAEGRSFQDWMRSARICSAQEWPELHGQENSLVEYLESAQLYYFRGVTQARLLQQASKSGLHADLQKDEADAGRNTAIHLVYVAQQAHGIVTSLGMALAAARGTLRVLQLCRDSPDLTEGQVGGEAGQTIPVLRALLAVLAEQKLMLEALRAVLPDRVQSDISSLELVLNGAATAVGKLEHEFIENIVVLHDAAVARPRSVAACASRVQAAAAGEVAKVRSAGIAVHASLRPLWQAISRQLEWCLLLPQGGSSDLDGLPDAVVRSLGVESSLGLNPATAGVELTSEALIVEQVPRITVGVDWLASTVTELERHSMHSLRCSVCLLMGSDEPAGMDVDSLAAYSSQIYQNISNLVQPGISCARSISKLALVVNSILSTIARQGFCRSDGEDAEFGDEAEKTTEGTGMGDGDTKGAKDVSNEIEDQDQLLTKEEAGQEQDANEQADTKSKGVEMDDDFDGQMEDVEQSDHSDSDDNEEDDVDRLDQQVGEVGDLADVVDEKDNNKSGEDQAKTEEASDEKKTKSGEPDRDFATGDLEPQPDGAEEERGEEPKRADETDAGDEADEGGSEPEEELEDQDDEQQAEGLMDLTSGPEPVVPELDLPEDTQLEDGEPDENIEGQDELEEDGKEGSLPDQEPQGDEHSPPDEEGEEEGEKGASDELGQDHEAADGADDAGENTIPDETEAVRQEDNTTGEGADTGAQSGNAGGSSAHEPLEGAGGGESQEQPAEGSSAPPGSGAGQASAPDPVNAVIDNNNTNSGGGADQRKQASESNPLRNLGSALEEWKRNLSVVADGSEDNPGDNESAEDAQTEGKEHRYLSEKEAALASDLQTLGDAAEDQVGDSLEKGAEENPMTMDVDGVPEAPNGATHVEKEDQAEMVTPAGDDEKQQPTEQDSASDPTSDPSANAIPLSKPDEAKLEGELYEGRISLTRKVHDMELGEEPMHPQQMQATALSDGISEEELANGAERWRDSERATAGLVGELTEQLRLILEPTLASRLAGEYRSGKRLNMKKVIAYIASQFRKDKIWLRRTQPDKRKYQVLLAIDNSLSMSEMGCSPFALQSLALISRAMGRLEVGEFGVVGFGGTSGPQYLHGLEKTFTDTDGARIMSKLNFDEDNTIENRPMVDVLGALDDELEKARGRQPSGTGSSLQQLVLIIADGRLHEKDALRRMVRDVTSKPGVLYAFILVDNPTSSLLDMKTVSFSEGKPVFTSYLDSFPFPFYIVLRETASLPRTLSNLLRQWFMLSSAS